MNPALSHGDLGPSRMASRGGRLQVSPTAPANACSDSCRAVTLIVAAKCVCCRKGEKPHSPDQPTNQPTSQPASQPTNQQPTDRPTKQTTNQPTKQAGKLSNPPTHTHTHTHTHTPSQPPSLPAPQPPSPPAPTHPQGTGAQGFLQGIRRSDAHSSLHLRKTRVAWSGAFFVQTERNGFTLSAVDPI